MFEHAVLSGEEIKFTEYLVLLADGFSIQVFNGMKVLDFRGIMSCPFNGVLHDLAMGPLLVNRALDGYNRKMDAPIQKSAYDVAQKSWYGYRESFKKFQEKEGVLSMEELAILSILKKIWREDCG